MTRRHRALARSLVAPLAWAAATLVARGALADNYVVPSGSMEPTVQVGDRILVDKRAYGLRVPLTDRYVLETAAPRRGDVVVLSSPESGVVLLKRVVATPGDHVEVREGVAIVNGVPETSPDLAPADPAPAVADEHRYLLDLHDGGGPDLSPRTLPANHYLVLGDHRGNSRDGRSFGLVERRAFLGRATGVFVRGGALTWRAL